MHFAHSFGGCVNVEMLQQIELPLGLPFLRVRRFHIVDAFLLRISFRMTSREFGFKHTFAFNW